MGLGVVTCSLSQFPLGVVEKNIEGNSMETMNRKNKVVVVMGATGTGKSRLSVDLAKHFPAEIVNADKMQVYEGLDIVTNKVTAQEQCGIPHHLLGLVDPDTEFSSADFRALASASIDMILRRGRLPIITGGSNSYIESLVSTGPSRHHLRYDCCFLWVDAAIPVLHTFLSDRVDRMVESGLLQEVSELFHPKADYSLGLRKAIGVPELDRYLRHRAARGACPETLACLLEAATEDIKANTRALSCRQVSKINRLRAVCRWDLHRLDATESLANRGDVSREAWERNVVASSVSIVQRFILRDLAMDASNSCALAPATRAIAAV